MSSTIHFINVTSQTCGLSKIGKALVSRIIIFSWYFDYRAVPLCTWTNSFRCLPKHCTAYCLWLLSLYCLSQWFPHSWPRFSPVSFACPLISIRYPSICLCNCARKTARRTKFLQKYTFHWVLCIFIDGGTDVPECIQICVYQKFAYPSLTD